MEQEPSDAKDFSAELLEVVQQALKLREADQLRLLGALAQSVQGARRLTDVEREALRRAEAIESLDVATTELRRRGALAGDELPSAGQYRDLEAELELPLSLAQVTRAFGLWRFAKQAYGGEWVPGGRLAAQLESEVHRRHTEDEHLRGLSRWLESRPVIRTQGAYDDFARAANQHLGGSGRRLALSRNIVDALRIRWSQALRVVKGELSLADAQARFAEEQVQDASSRELVGKDGVAALLGLSKAQAFRSTRTADLPKHVARVSGRRVWRSADIEAYREGQQVTSETLTEEIVDSEELSRRLGRSRKWIASQARLERFHLVPKPAGQVSQAYYWWRSDVLEWERATPTTPDA